MVGVNTWIEPRGQSARSGGPFRVSVEGVGAGQEPWVSLVAPDGAERMPAAPIDRDAAGKYVAELRFPRSLAHGERVFVLVSLRAADSQVASARSREPHVIDNAPRVAAIPVHGQAPAWRPDPDPKRGPAVKAAAEHPLDLLIETPPWGARTAEWLLWQGAEEARVPLDLPAPDDTSAAYRARAPIPGAASGWRAALVVTWEGAGEKVRAWSVPVELVPLSEALDPPVFPSVEQWRLVRDTLWKETLTAVRNTRLDIQLRRASPPARWDLPPPVAEVPGQDRRGSVEVSLVPPPDAGHGDLLYLVVGSTDVLGHRTEGVSRTLEVDWTPRVAFTARHLPQPSGSATPRLLAGEVVRAEGVAPGASSVSALLVSTADEVATLSVYPKMGRAPCPPLALMEPGAESAEEDRSTAAARRVFSTAGPEGGEDSSGWVVLDRRPAELRGGTWAAELTVPAGVARGARIAVAMTCTYDGERYLAAATEQVLVRRFDAELAAELRLELIRWQHPEEGAVLPKDRIWLRLSGIRDWPASAEVWLHGEPLVAVPDPQWARAAGAIAWRIDLPELARWTGTDIVARAAVAGVDGAERCELEARRSGALLGIDAISPARDVPPGGKVVAAVRGAPGLQFECELCAGAERLAVAASQGTGKRQDIALGVPDTVPAGTPLRVRCSATAPWGEVVVAEGGGPAVKV